MNSLFSEHRSSLFAFPSRELVRQKWRVGQHRCLFWKPIVAWKPPADGQKNGKRGRDGGLRYRAYERSRVMDGNKMRGDASEKGGRDLEVEISVKCKVRGAG